MLNALKICIAILRAALVAASDSRFGPGENVGNTLHCEYSKTLQNLSQLELHEGCLGFEVQEGPRSPEDCKFACYREQICSVWKFSSYPGTCYFGIPKQGCYTRNSQFKAEAGERVQHGHVEVMRNMQGIFTKGLLLVDQSPKDHDNATAVERCRLWCYSDVSCTVWQYGAGSCWIEHLPGYQKGEAVSSSSDYASGDISSGLEVQVTSLEVFVGETIDHVCLPHETPFESSLNGILFCLAGVGGILVARFGIVAVSSLSEFSENQTINLQLLQIYDQAVQQEEEEEKV